MADSFTGDWATGYDARVRCVIPGYEAIHNIVGAVLAHHLPPEARVLVAGCGTGMELLCLGRVQPGWRLVGVDPAPEMVAVARRRAGEAGLAERIEIAACDVAALPDPEGAGFDAATLVLVLQFLPDDGAKLELLREIAARLRPGAPFVLVDAQGEPGSAALAESFERWKSYQVWMGLERRYVEEELKPRRERMQIVPEARQLELLAQAGFARPERFFSAFHFNGWLARKAAQPE